VLSPSKARRTLNGNRDESSTEFGRAPVRLPYLYAGVLAQADPWAHLRIIQPGRNVYVKLHTNKSVKGKMDAWRPDGLTILQGGSHVVSIQKPDVAQVALLIGKSRGRKALYAGLIAGAAAGTLTGIAYKSSDCCEVPTAAVVAGSGAFYGGVAAGIAALFPQHHEVVYSAAKPPASSSGGGARPEK
jgi:hypothetical protein